jgi:hypothetical protein
MTLDKHGGSVLMSDIRSEKTDSHGIRAYCPRCIHFSITWDRQAPYGCRAYGVRTSQHPSRSVLAASGIPCQLFRDKRTG